MGRRLYRSRSQRLIAGVAGGLAEYFQLDVSIVRLFWLVAVLFVGSGLLAYIVAWIVIPKSKINPLVNHSDSLKSDQTEETRSLKEHRQYFGGVLLITVGCFFLLSRFIPRETYRYFWPLLLIGSGIWLFRHR